MVSLVQSISCAMTRLNLLPKYSFPSTVRAIRTLQQLQPTKRESEHEGSPIISHSNSVLCHPSSPCFVSQIHENATGETADDLVFLGIETSCDDTAAAVVRPQKTASSNVSSFCFIF